MGIVEDLYNKFKLAQTCNTRSKKLKIFTVEDIFCAGVLLRFTENPKLYKILKSQESSLLDMDSLEFILKRPHAKDFYLKLIEHLKRISQKSSLQKKAYFALESMIDKIYEQSLQGPINQNKEELVEILLNLPQSLVPVQKTLFTMILRLAMYLTNTANSIQMAKIIDGVFDVLEKNSVSGHYKAALLEVIASKANIIFKNNFSEKLKERLANNKFTPEVLHKIYDLKLGLQDCQWLNKQIEDFISKNDNVNNSGCIVTAELINMVAGVSKYTEAMKVIACARLDSLTSEQKINFQLAIMLLSTIALNFKAYYGQNKHLREKHDFTEYLQHVISSCQSIKFKVFGVLRLEQQINNGLHLFGAMYVSLLRLPNGDYHFYDPECTNNGFIINATNIRLATDYIQGKLTAQIKQKFPECGLDSVVMAPFKVTKRLSQTVTPRLTLMFTNSPIPLRSQTPVGMHSKEYIVDEHLPLVRNKSTPKF